MNKRRILLFLLFVQLLGLILLTQVWFTISMTIDGKIKVLGGFQGSETYSILLPVTLFILVSSLIAFLLTPRVARSVLFVQAIISLILMVWVTTQLSTNNIAELDPQLERLTGIAKTHGVAGLQTEGNLFPWLWLTGCLIAMSLAIYLAIKPEGWNRETGDKKSNRRDPASAIDIWDSQRG